MPTFNSWSTGAAIKRNRWDGRIREWVRTPNFGALPKDSKPVNPYGDLTPRSLISQTLKTSRVGAGSVVTVYNDYELTPAELRSAVNSREAAMTDWAAKRAETNNRVAVKLLGKIADTKVNVAVALAEAGKTSTLIFDIAHRIDKAYRAFRKGDLKGVAKYLNITPKRLKNNWLEYKYGWMPLLMDVKGAAEFFAQQHVVRSPKFVAAAVEKSVITVSSQTMSPAYGGTVADWPQNILETYYYEARLKAWCELSSPHLSELQQIGLTNPALVAWELVPFSFVFDWFVEVGNYLEGLTALNGVTVRRACASVVWTKAFSLTQPATVKVSGGTTYTHSARDWLFSERQYTRNVYNVDPLSVYPPVNTSLSFSKLVTSLALLQGSNRTKTRI